MIRLIAGCSVLATLVLGAPAARAARPPHTFTTIGYFVGKPGTVGRLRDISDAGIDIAIGGDSLAHTQTFARNLRRTGRPLRGILTYSSPDSGRDNSPVIFGNSDPRGCMSAIRATLADTLFNDPRYIAGWSVWDEPRDADFPRLLAMTDIIDSTFHGSIMPFVNLLPISAMGASGLGCAGDRRDPYRHRSKYGCYMDQYLAHFRTLPPPLLSEDSYPFEHSDTTYYDDIFTLLKSSRDKALEYSTPAYRVPWCQIIQLSPRIERGRTHAWPTMAQVRFHAYAAIAYGATWIGYWTLVPPRLPEAVTYGAGILNDDGTKTARYDSVRALNAEMHTLGPTLVRLTPLVTWHQAANGQTGLADDLIGGHAGQADDLIASLTGTGNEGMVGRFRDTTTADEYLFVVNKNFAAARSFTIGLKHPPEVLQRFDKTTGRPVTVPYDPATASFTVTNLAPGDGELFRLVLPPGAALQAPRRAPAR